VVFYLWSLAVSCGRLWFSGGPINLKSKKHTKTAWYGTTTTTTTTILWPLVRDYPGEPVPEETLTHPPSSSSSLYQLLPSTTIHLFKLYAWQSFCTTSLHVLFGLPLGLEPSTSYSIHIFTQSVSSFRITCPYHLNLNGICFYSAPQCSHCKRCTSYGNSVRLSCHTPVLCQNDGT